MINVYYFVGFQAKKQNKKTTTTATKTMSISGQVSENLVVENLRNHAYRIRTTQAAYQLEELK